MKIIERTHNSETNEILDIEREMTSAEVKSYQDAQTAAQAKATKQAEADSAKAAAQAKLAALGLTTDDLKALGL
jgi:hypothetical protein